MPMPLRRHFLPLVCLAAATANLAAAEDQTIKVSTKTSDEKTVWRAQSLGPMAIPVGDTLELRGMSIKAEVTEKGELTLDLGTKFPKKLRHKGHVSVQLKDPEDEKKKLRIKLEFLQDKDGKWTYRNATVLCLKFKKPKAELVVVDANGNGAYNDAHVDGMAWAGHDVLFPLPAVDERWTTEDADITGLTFGPWGQDAAAKGRPLASIEPGALPILINTNQERIKLGLTPRPEDPALTRPLQKHCQYMALQGKLSHPEDANKPGYSPEGHKSGLRSILGMRPSPNDLASGMVDTLYHRFDVIRANTAGFGVGWVKGKGAGFGGIDGRTTLTKNAPAHWWPILCPIAEQTDVPTYFRTESPDPIKGDTAAGFPVSATFHTNKLKLEDHYLKVVGKKDKLGPAIKCYTFDAGDHMMKFLNAVGIIAQDPLEGNTTYEVMFKVSVDDQPWQKTWRFTTRKGMPGRRPIRRR